MGIESRDYIRESNTGSFSYGHRGSLWAIKYLLIANIAVFALDSLLGIHVNDWLALKLSVETSSSATKLFKPEKYLIPVPVERDSPVSGGQTVTENGNTWIVRSPDEQDKPDTIVESNISVKYEGKYRFNPKFWIVTWKGREWLVSADSMRIDPFGSFALVWQLLTYGFCHGGMMHIAFNMYALWLFGRLIEPIYGSREFMAIFLVGIVVSGLFHVGYQMLQNDPTGTVGASGGVMAITFLCAMNYPRVQLLLMFIIPIELRWFAVMYAVIDVMGALNPDSHVAHAAHLGGAAFGVAYKYYGWRMYGIWNRLRGGIRLPRLRSRPKVRLYKPSVSSIGTSKRDLDSQVDKILDKISKQGESSLTDDERELLKQASQKYKKR